MVNYVFSSNYRRDSDKFKELEDHIGFIVLFMQKMIEEELSGNEKSAQLVRESFCQHYKALLWMIFIAALYAHGDSHFYQNLAVIMQSFMALERLYLDVKKPVKTNEDEAPKIFTKELKKTRKPITPRPKKNMEEFVL